MGVRRLDLVFETLADASTDVRNATENGYELAGSWTLAQILEHLNLTMRMTLDGPNFSASPFMRPIYRVVLMPVIKKGKPVKLRAKAPDSLAPGENLNEHACADKFHSLVSTLCDPATEFQPFHPLLGNLKRDQWLMMQKWHAAHHLSFVVPAT